MKKGNNGVRKLFSFLLVLLVLTSITLPASAKSSDITQAESVMQDVGVSPASLNNTVRTHSGWLESGGKEFYVMTDNSGVCELLVSIRDFDPSKYSVRVSFYGHNGLWGYYDDDFKNTSVKQYHIEPEATAVSVRIYRRNIFIPEKSFMVYGSIV